MLLLLYPQQMHWLPMLNFCQLGERHVLQAGRWCPHLGGNTESTPFAPLRRTRREKNEPPGGGEAACRETWWKGKALVYL